MSAKGNAPNRRVAAIQAKKKRKQPKKSKPVGEASNTNKDRERARETRETRNVEVDRNRSFEEVRLSSGSVPLYLCDITFQPSPVCPA